MDRLLLKAILRGHATELYALVAIMATIGTPEAAREAVRGAAEASMKLVEALDDGNG